MTESKEIRLVDQDGEALASNFALCPCAYILNINLHSQRSEDQSYDFCVKQAPSVPEASVEHPVICLAHSHGCHQLFVQVGQGGGA